MLIGKCFILRGIGGLNIFINNFLSILMEKGSWPGYSMIKHFCKGYCRMY